MIVPGSSVIIPAAGSGARLGEAIPKAFVKLSEQTILQRCIAGVEAADIDAEIIVVVPPDLIDRTRVFAPQATVVAGGARRVDSVRAGLAACHPDAQVILVHDAARPLAPPEMFERIVAAVRSGYRAVVPGLPVADTLKLVATPEQGEPPDATEIPVGRIPPAARIRAVETVRRTVDRDSLRAIQTPQGFTREALVAAHADDAGAATDDAGLAERQGIGVHVVAGDARAMKITTPWDLRVARMVVDDQKPDLPDAGHVTTGEGTCT